jgi:hypothetical protein
MKFDDIEHLIPSEHKLLTFELLKCINCYITETKQLDKVYLKIDGISYISLMIELGNGLIEMRIHSREVLYNIKMGSDIFSINPCDKIDQESFEFNKTKYLKQLSLVEDLMTLIRINQIG